MNTIDTAKAPTSIYYDVFRRADKRFRQGDRITNKEVLMLLHVYQSSAKHLFFLGELYKLAWKDAFDQYHRLLDMANARKLNLEDSNFEIEYMKSMNLS